MGEALNHSLLTGTISVPMDMASVNNGLQQVRTSARWRAPEFRFARLGRAPPLRPTAPLYFRSWQRANTPWSSRPSARPRSNGPTTSEGVHLPPTNPASPTKILEPDVTDRKSTRLNSSHT